MLAGVIHDFHLNHPTFKKAKTTIVAELPPPSDAKDLNLKKENLEQAVRQGDIDALIMLGDFFMLEMKNFKNAYSCFQAAAKHGDTNALNRLAKLEQIGANAEEKANLQKCLRYARYGFLSHTPTALTDFQKEAKNDKFLFDYHAVTSFNPEEIFPSPQVKESKTDNEESKPTVKKKPTSLQKLRLLSREVGILFHKDHKKLFLLLQQDIDQLKNDKLVVPEQLRSELQQRLKIMVNVLIILNKKTKKFSDQELVNLQKTIFKYENLPEATLVNMHGFLSDKDAHRLALVDYKAAEVLAKSKSSEKIDFDLNADIPVIFAIHAKDPSAIDPVYLNALITIAQRKNLPILQNPTFAKRARDISEDIPEKKLENEIIKILAEPTYSRIKLSEYTKNYQTILFKMMEKFVKVVSELTVEKTSQHDATVRLNVQLETNPTTLTSFLEELKLDNDDNLFIQLMPMQDKQVNFLHTFLLSAIVQDSPKINELLIQYGNKLDIAFEFNKFHCPTPLFLAVQVGNSKIIETLLKAGFDPNKPGYAFKHAMTPLMMALITGRGDLVRLLLEHGSNPEQLCEIRFQGKNETTHISPLAYVKLAGNDEYIKLLESFKKPDDNPRCVIM